MGQKTHPIGFRLGILKDWSSRWYAPEKMPELIAEDEKIRAYIKNRLGHGAISRIEIERTAQHIVLVIFTARPGVIIGRKGSEVNALRDQLIQLTGGKEISIKIEEVKRPELDAQLVGDNIAYQLSQRVSFRRAMKKAVTAAMRLGGEGIKIICSGRLGGGEYARREGYHEGRVPLHTLRADIDYAVSTARTTYGTIGVKVWIYKGEKLEEGKQVPEALSRSL